MKTFDVNQIKIALEQKCSVKKFARVYERPSMSRKFLTLDCGDRAFSYRPFSYRRRRKKRRSKSRKFLALDRGDLAFSGRPAKKKLFILFNNGLAVKARFSRDLFLQSFLLTHQKTYGDFAQRHRACIKMLQNASFCTLLLLKRKRGGFFVRAAGFVCFLPRKTYQKLFGRIAAVHFNARLTHQLYVLFLFVLKFAFRIGANFRIFSLMCGYARFSMALKKKLIPNKALFSNKLPFKQRFCGALPVEKHRKLTFRFKLSSSYFRKKFINKKRRKRGRAKYLIYFKNPKPKLKKQKSSKLLTEPLES